MAAAAAAASVLDTKTCNDVTANVGIIVTGNSGVGKSLLVNVLLGENRFQHGISATRYGVLVAFVIDVLTCW